MTRAFRALMVLLVAGAFAGSFLGGSAAWADSSTLKPFFGIYEGASLAPSREAQPRDLKVLIQPASDDGFTIAWQTTLYESFDETRRKTQSLQFRPRKDNPELYEVVATALSVGMAPTKDPLDGAPFAWARVLGNVMSVYVLTISKNGDFVIQTYDRALTPGGMALAFTRVRNGNMEKRLWGALDRVDG